MGEDNKFVEVHVGWLRDRRNDYFWHLYHHVSLSLIDRGWMHNYRKAYEDVVSRQRHRYSILHLSKCHNQNGATYS
jgi:hypothetical protein